VSATRADVERQLADVVRIEGGRILAVLAASTRDLQLAEDAVQDASVAAIEVWTRTGIPSNPTGWLYVAARRKAIDVIRRESTRDQREAASGTTLREPDREVPAESVIRDDVLRLVFTCCHPSLALDARVALALRTLCGLSTAEVARALLVSEPTMAKRLVRTKQKIARAAIPYHIPDGRELGARLAGVHAVVHLVYTCGHHAAGDEVVRVDLCEEAVRLARLLVDLVPGEAGSEALLALLLLTDARRPARLADDGSLVPLEDQDRRRWHRAAVDEGVALLRRSLDRSDGVADPYQLQAAIAACHSTAPSFAATDWREIVRLYGILADVHPNPIVDLNAAVALAEVDGPAAALDALDRVDASARSHLWQAGRGEMLLRLGRGVDAAEVFTAALADAPTDAERRHLRTRLDAARTAPAPES